MLGLLYKNIFGFNITSYIDYFLVVRPSIHTIIIINQKSGIRLVMQIHIWTGMYVHTGPEEAILHWSGKFYLNMCGKRPCTRGHTVYSYCTISMQSMQILGGLGYALQENLKKQMLWDWIWGHFGDLASYLTIAI